jgi:hypothetical protein
MKNRRYPRVISLLFVSCLTALADKEKELEPRKPAPSAASKDKAGKADAPAPALLAADSQTVSLENGLSPNRRFEIVLEADKGSSRFKAYEFKGDQCQYPAFLIVDATSRKVITRVPWEGDTGGDEQPLKLHSTVLWNPGSTAVALTTRERFYTHCVVRVYDASRRTFVKVEFPDYKTMTGFPPPAAEDLRSRGYDKAVEWNKKGHLTVELKLSPASSEERPDSLHHRVTLEVSASGMKAVHREMLPQK